MNRINISKNLREFRKLLNLKQDEFAKPLGITGGYISAIEKGKSNLSESVLCLIEINYRLNRKWLLKDEGEPFVQEWLDDKLNLFEKDGGPILDNFKMNLEVITREEAERRKAAADPWQEILDMARQVLESGTDHSGSLASNIKLSFNTIQDKKLLEEKCNKALNKIENLEHQLSTAGREKEESPAKAAGC